ncbi:MAG TPA: hypothetical protein VJB98_02160 [Candidatus Paceibacterota bacterium]
MTKHRVATQKQVRVAMTRPSGHYWGPQYRAVLVLFGWNGNRPTGLEAIRSAVLKEAPGKSFWLSDIRYMNRSLRAMGAHVRLRFVKQGNWKTAGDAERKYQFVCEEAA